MNDNLGEIGNVEASLQFAVAVERVVILSLLGMKNNGGTSSV